jgi:hypothetical protein
MHRRRSASACLSGRVRAPSRPGFTPNRADLEPIRPSGNRSDVSIATASLASESLSADLTTSFLGALAAALLAYWLARRSWRVQERRKVYAHCVHATSEFLEACGPWLQCCINHKARPTYPEERDRIFTALGDMKVAVRDIALVGTEPLAEHASRMVTTALDISEMARADAAQGLRDSPP